MYKDIHYCIYNIMSKHTKKFIVFDDSDDEVYKMDVEEKRDELQIRRMTLHEQILHRPDTYIGSVRKTETSDRIWVKSKDDDKFVCKKVTFAEGLLRIFMEVACNVIDNIWRSNQFKIPAKMIKISVDRDTGYFSIWNDGKPIPLDKFTDDKGNRTDEYKPEVIFGTLLTSTNYDDNEKRKTSGRNGYGVKLVSIFSSEFEIELFNPDFNTIYKQKWRNNMFDRDSPVLVTDKSKFPKTLGKMGYTMIKWKPDYKRFNMDGLDDDFMSVVEKSIYDYSLIAKLNGVTTFYNNVEVPVTDLKSYANLYFRSDLSDEIIQFKSKDCIVVLTPRADESVKNDLMHISFMNGILTVDGGVHVDAWEETIFRPIVNKINKTNPDDDKKAKKPKKSENKKFQIDITHIRRHFTLFIVAEADNPDFKGQNKTYFNGPSISASIKNSDIAKIMKWSFMDKIDDVIKLRELSILKDVGKKRRNYVKIENLDDANFAGDKKYGRDCLLALTEGDSAATYVVNGMKYGIDGKKGHDFIGVMPIRGKFLNVRNASNATIIKNKEVKALIQSIGLEYGLDYTDNDNRNKLRYGKLYIVADGDFDGLHIIGLMYNFFDTLFPSLLKAGDFFHFLRIPIVKINTKQENMSFLFYYDAQKWIDNNKPKKNQIRYFKGLGTSNKQDIKEDFGRYPVSISYDKEGGDLLQQVFHKDESDFRKEWLLSYKPCSKSRNTEDYKIEELKISNFLNEEMINFSIDDCKRSIPSVLDGLKESQRKTLYAAIVKKLAYNKKSMKVAQFAGTVAEKTGYHHGEQNLYETITKMAQRFTGSNNIPLFYADGQFGSRLKMGKDAAKARYIYTKLEMLTRLIFRPEDDPYLANVNEDGDILEKNYYLPIIPMLLVNGASGIGTGSSCNVPMFNPIDIISWIETWIQNKIKNKDEVSYPQLIPFWNGFKGKIEVSDNKFVTYGILEQVNKNKYRITELPVGRRSLSIEKFREQLEDMLENKQIKRMINHSTDNEVDFTVIVDDDENIIPSMENMKLIDTISTTNMVLFDQEGKLRKFENVTDIMTYFCELRYKLYKTRKQGQIKELKEQLKWTSNKIRFVEMIDSRQLEIRNKDEHILEQEMINKGFDKKPKMSKNKIEKDDSNEEDNDINEENNDTNEEDNETVTNLSFDYLLNMQVRVLNVKSNVYKNLLSQQEQLQNNINNLENTHETTIWKTELQQLKKEYYNWSKNNDFSDKREVNKKTKN